MCRCNTADDDLSWVTIGHRPPHPSRFEQYRDGLLDLEIPGEHLPTAAELGLDDLT
jgi:hypothetical protein